MYSLVWQSVMWRPGKLRFLIGVKNPLLSGRPRPPENTAPCGAAPVARFATSVGLPPPFVAPPATVSHPDRRALLIPSVAQHSSASPTAMQSNPDLPLSTVHGFTVAPADVAHSFRGTSS